MATLLEKTANKIRDFHQCLGHYISKLRTKSNPEKRRKLNAKSSSSGISRTETLEVTYQYKKDWRGRRYSETPHSAQSMSQLLQTLLLGHTFDIDVKNSIFVCLKQAIDRLEVKHCEAVAGVKETLAALASDRAKFCKDEMGVDEVSGKAVLHSMVNGGACPDLYKD